MPATVTEQPGREITRRNGVDTAKRKYWINDAADEADALTALLAFAPTTIGSLARDQITITEIIDPNGAGGLFEAMVEWNVPRVTSLAARRSFRTTGLTRRILQSLETVHASSGAPDHGGAIGVTADGVDGCDIDGSETEMTLTFTIATSAAGVSYVDQLEALLQHTNDATWRDFSAGVVRFCGYSLDDQEDLTTVVTLSFKLAANVASTTLGGFTFAKAGHDYVWPLVRQQDGGTFLTEAVYVERVYESGDFTLLGVP